MAANINLHQPRIDYARAERDDENNQGEAAAADGQTAPPSETIIAAPPEQQGQYSGDGGSSSSGNNNGTHEPSTPPPPPSELEAAAPFPAHLRYGLGDVSVGRPDYARFGENPADQAKPFQGEPNPREWAFTPATNVGNTNAGNTPAENKRAENTPSSTAVVNVTATTKPIPQPKPLGHVVPTSATDLAQPARASVINDTPRLEGTSVRSPVKPIAASAATAPVTPSTTVTPYSSLFVPGNALYERENFTIDSPVFYPPATPTGSASQLTEANDYAAAHDLSSQDAAKLAALMANNHSPGREWLSLRPEVLASVLDAINVNPDGSFDVSGVFGGALGYYDSRINTPVEARLDENGNVVIETGSAESSNLTPIRREGWVYEAGVDGGPGTYHVSDDTLARYNAPYQPMLDAGFQQVNRNYTNDTVLSVGAEGGYRDLSQLEFNPVYGLISPSSNYIPVDSTTWADVVVPALIFAAAGAGIGVAAGLGVAGSTAVGSFVSTLGTTLDLNAAFRAGAIGFISAGFAQWLTPQLLPGLSADSVIRQGVQSLISGTTAGALQGDIRQGFINGVTSFISLQLASGLGISRTLTSALIRSFSDPNSALTGLLSDVVIGAVTDGAQGIVAENDIMDRLMQDQPGLTAEQARTLAQTMLATGREIRDINNGKPPVDAETQQQITWAREAIDSGHPETAAGFLNDIVDRRAAANPDASRADIANELMRELGIKPDTLGFVVGANGRVTAVDRLILGGEDADNATSSDLRLRNMMERIRGFNPNSSESALRTEAERAIRLENSTSGIGQLRPELSNNEIRQIALGLETDRERIRAYADRLAAIPEDQKPLELELIRREFAGSELMQRFTQLIGPVTPLVGSEPLTRQQELRLLDVVLGVAPITGEATSIYEFIYGKSPASQEEASRVWAAVGILTAGYGRVGGRLLTAEQRAARELEYMGGGTKTPWNRQPPGRSTDAAAVLRGELGAAPPGMINPEAHHLVGFGIADRETQQILNRFGITPNSGENGIWLSAEVHNMTRGGNAYKDWVAAQIQGAVSREDALNRLNTIRDTLRNLKPSTTPPWRTGK